MFMIPNSFNRKLNVSLAKGLVNKFASCKSVPMNLISHVPFDICSLRKWCLISICLVLECMIWFFVKLSHNIGILLSKIPKSFNYWLSHRVWAQQLPATIYSASAVERATHACFLHCQDIKLDPSKWQVPLVLFISILQPAKSELE